MDGIRTSIAFKVHDIVVGIVKNTRSNQLALVVLKSTVVAYLRKFKSPELLISKQSGSHLLQAHAKMCKLSMYSPSITIVHRYEVRLSRPQFSKHNHPGTRCVDARSLVHQFRSGPRIADPYRRVSSDPERDERSVQVFGELLEIYPGFVIG